MKIKEAIAILKSIRLPIGEQFPYRAEMTAYDMAIAALEKQEAKKPLYSVMYPVLQEYDMFQCPVCGQDLFYSISNGQDWYCRDCGQKIDWTEKEGKI